MSRQRGFTLIELLVVVTIIAILITIALPKFMRAKEKAKEAEVKSNLHSIQISLERYAVDHSGKYPRYILGGDDANYARGLFRTGGGLNPDVADPLIAYGYIKSYPHNPFTSGRDALEWTGWIGEPGTGDVRFGWSGMTMGNGLGDPRYFWSEYGKKTSLWSTGYIDGALGSGYLKWTWSGRAIPDRKADSPFIIYSDDPSNGSTIVHWPGNFGYRSFGPMLSGYKLRTGEFDVWDRSFRLSRITTYILYAYGSNRTKGEDIIRNTNVDGHLIFNTNGYDEKSTYTSGYYDTSWYRFTVHFSPPEVFGGGQMGQMPIFPPYNACDDVMLGAPDGYPDAVILVLSNS